MVDDMMAVFVKDEKTYGFSTYFVDKPHIIAEGKNELEASKNLSKLYKKVMLFEKKHKLNM